MPDESDLMTDALDPWARAALRQQMAVQPPGGRQEGALTQGIGNAVDWWARKKAAAANADTEFAKSFIPHPFDTMQAARQQSMLAAEGDPAFDPGASMSAALYGVPYAGKQDASLGTMFLKPRYTSHPDHYGGEHAFRGGALPQRDIQLDHLGNPQREQSAWTITNDQGKPEIPLSLEYYHQGRNWVFKDPYPPNTLKVGMIGDFENPAVQQFGPTEIRSLLKALRKEYPDTEAITGFRVSGMRSKVGGGAEDALMWLPGAKGRAAFEQQQKENLLKKIQATEDIRAAEQSRASVPQPYRPSGPDYSAQGFRVRGPDGSTHTVHYRRSIDDLVRLGWSRID